MTRDERGSISPMIIGFTALVLMLIAVVVDVSAAHVRRQSLANLADGAALYAADSGARTVYSTGLAKDRLPQAAAAARAGATQYLAQVGALGDYPGLRVDAALADGGRSVRVRVSAPMTLPLGFPGAPLRTTVSAEGSATVRLRR